MNSRDNEVGYNELTKYNEMEISPIALNALIITRFSGYNEGIYRSQALPDIDLLPFLLLK